jgi:hypothetical protein
MNDDKRVRIADDLKEQVWPLLEGQPPDSLGAALGEMCATFLAAHSAEHRVKQRRLLIELIDNLLPLIIEEKIEAGIVPPSWRGTSQ